MPKRGICAFRAVYVGIVWISSCLWLIENQLKYWATLKLPKQYIRGNTQRMSSNNEMPLWSTGFCHLRFQHFSLKFRWQNPVDERRSSATCPKRIWTQWCWSARNGTVRRRSYVSLVLAHDSKTVPAPSERTTGLSSCCYCNIGDPWLRILHPMDPGYGKIVSINWNRLSQGILQHPGIKKIILYDPHTNNTWDNFSVSTGLDLDLDLFTHVEMEEIEIQGLGRRINMSRAAVVIVMNCLADTILKRQSNLKRLVFKDLTQNFWRCNLIDSKSTCFLRNWGKGNPL